MYASGFCVAITTWLNASLYGCIGNGTDRCCRMTTDLYSFTVAYWEVYCAVESLHESIAAFFHGVHCSAAINIALLRFLDTTWWQRPNREYHQVVDIKSLSVT